MGPSFIDAPLPTPFKSATNGALDDLTYSPDMNTISNMMGMLRALDLFCGCGGLSEGARIAGYDVIAGVDIEPHYIQTFRHNFPKAQALTESIAAQTPGALAERLSLEPGELGLLMGGPPCQGFSKNVPRRYRFLEDPKNLLVKAFLDYAEHFLPTLILMENVAEMKNGFSGRYTDEVITRLEACGYTVSHAVLNAADYGVPQRRRRAFFFANRLGSKFRIPSATHGAAALSDGLFALKPHVSVWDAISDLLPLEHGEDRGAVPYLSQPGSDYQGRVRGGADHVRNHVTRFLQPTQLARLKALKPGQGHKDLPPPLRVKSGYSGAYGRLTKDMVAPTITRWVFHPGSGRWGHPVDERVLSIREVARIQGFPDSFEFVGTYTQQAGQLGNAVPPLLAAHILKDLQGQLDLTRDSIRALNSSTVSRSVNAGKSKAMAC